MDLFLAEKRAQVVVQAQQIEQLKHLLVMNPQQHSIHSNKSKVQHKNRTKITTPTNTSTTSETTSTKGTKLTTVWPQITKITNEQDYCQQHEHVENVFEMKQIDVLYGDGWPEKYNYDNPKLEKIDDRFGNRWPDE